MKLLNNQSLKFSTRLGDLVTVIGGLVDFFVCFIICNIVYETNKKFNEQDNDKFENSSSESDESSVISEEDYLETDSDE